MQVLRLCKEVGLVKMGVVALDGSTIAANAALEANRTYAHIQGEAERRLRVEKMLNDAQTQDEAEDRWPLKMKPPVKFIQDSFSHPECNMYVADTGVESLNAL